MFFNLFKKQSQLQRLAKKAAARRRSSTYRCQVESMEEKVVMSAVPLTAPQHLVPLAQTASYTLQSAQPQAAAAATAIPSSTTVYKISTYGTSYYGNTNFLSQSTHFTVANTFSRNGAAVIAPTQDPFNVSHNGVNPRDFGFANGNVGVGGAGVSSFSSNTNLNRLFGYTTGGAAIDTTYVSVSGNHLRIIVDGSKAQLNTLNTFVVGNSIFSSNIYQTVAGEVDVDFSSNGQVISGSYVFYGQSLTGAGTAAVSGQFYGTKA